MLNIGTVIALIKNAISPVKTDITKLTPAATASDIGKALIVKTVADGVPTSYEYGEAGSVDPQDIADAVDDWLEEHPEATTTVEDGAVSYEKLDTALKGDVDTLTTTTYVPQILNKDRAWNAYGVQVGDTFNPSSMGSVDGAYCAKITVNEGERYKIVANGTAYAYRSYIITNSSNIVTRISTTAINGIITIEQGEKTLYVMMPSYNSETDGSWLVVETKTINDIKNDVANFPEKNLNSKVTISEYFHSGEGYNISGNNVGDKYTGERTSNNKVASEIITVEQNTKYYIYGEGNPNSFCMYAVLDENKYILEIYKAGTNHRTVPKEINPPSGSAYIIVNLWNYDSETDYIEKLKTENINGLRDNVYNPLKGKTILLLGDSILGNDRYCGVANYLGQYTGATIINGAIGGTRICGTTRGVADYTPFDGENLVTAITTDVWTDQDASASNVVAYVSDETLPALKAMDLDDVDIVIFNWMANDYTSNTTAAQYKAAFENVVGLLMTANPKLRLLAATMEWFWTNGGGTDVTSETIGTGYDAADCTIEVAGKMHVPVIDMYRNSPISNYTKEIYLDSDKTHLNTKGNKLYARLLTDKLKSLL